MLLADLNPKARGVREPNFWKVFGKLYEGEFGGVYAPPRYSFNPANEFEVMLFEIYNNNDYGLGTSPLFNFSVNQPIEPYVSSTQWHDIQDGYDIVYQQTLQRQTTWPR